MAGIGLIPQIECTSKLKSFPKDSGIYFIFCESNCGIYIGQSKNVLVRMKEHSNSLIKGKHRNKHMQNCFNKYGYDNMFCGLVCLTDNLDLFERKLINFFSKKSLSFNKDSGGNKNKIVSVETRRKQSESAKRKFLTMRHPLLGVKYSDDHRKRLSEAHIGMPNKRKGIKTGKPSWNSGSKGLQKSNHRKRVNVVDAYSNLSVGVFDSILDFRNKMNYKSKNQKKVSDSEIRLGRYILNLMPDIASLPA